MEERIQNIRNEALAQILSTSSIDELEDLKIHYLGRKGKVNEITREIPKLDPEIRGMIGQLINDTRTVIADAVNSKLSELKTETSKNTWFDPTVPGIKPPIGHLHLVTQAIEEISGIFDHLGFVRVRYPEVEWDWFAFEALNMPKDHPARDEWETFFVRSEEDK